ncbi:MAG: ribonuclease HII [Spirochaetaceae bacterium]|nr:ribonuclease HII [Spirochaetaceae bacterium]
MIMGLDEAGRGPLAGPVCAAAVILPVDFPSGGRARGILDDSKKLGVREREQAAEAIYQSGALWGVGWATALEIDRLNIHHASLLAMRRAFFALASDPRYAALADRVHAVADGRFSPEIPVPCRALVKADAQIPPVMAASILAKTSRDSLMARYALALPEYGYEKHKGYPTKLHYERIARHGPSPIQRMSYRWK